VNAIGQLLQRESTRLVTLTGPGGIGKTRLALQVAAELPEHFPDGTWFVSLAPISDPDLVIPTISQTLGLQEARDISPLEHLKSALKEKQTLLLLDNFEQVVSAATSVADLLTGCPRLKVLVTSREVLHLRAEHDYAVPPLMLPDPKHLPDLLSLSQYAAVALFIERAQAVKSEFQVTNSSAPAVAEICVRLDGLPLALELAAARIRLFPPQALLTLLTSSTRDMPARQQTLRNTIAWSYDLLDASEQQLFRRLSVFVGGCTLEAAEAICNLGNASTGKGISLFDGVASLIDKSLLQQTEQGGEEPRLAMLETIRDYGQESLVASGEAEITQHAHATYHLTLAEEVEPKLTGAGMGSWLERLQREHENLRAALVWLVEHNEQEAALRLGGALLRFWLKCGHLSEGRTELARALAANERDVATLVRARALCAAGRLAVEQKDIAQVEVLCGQSLVHFRALGDLQGIGTSLTWLGYAAWERCDYVAARSLLEEAVTLCREVDYQDTLTQALSYLSKVCLFQGEYDQARTLVEEALVLSRETGDSWNNAIALWNLAQVTSYQGDLAQTLALLEECLALCRQEGYKGMIAESLTLWGTTAIQQGDIAQARSRLEESLALYKEVGNQQNRDRGQSLFGMAYVLYMQGDFAAARSYLEESFAFYNAGNNKFFIALCLAGFTVLAAAQEEWTWAVRLSGAAEALCQAIKGVLPLAARAMQEFAISAARAQLGEKPFAAAWAEGRTMRPEQALAAQATVPMPIGAPIEPSTTPPAQKTLAFPDGLTAREVDVLRLVAQGLTNEQVAEQLVISPRTVNTHLTSIFSKIGVSSHGAATRYAIEHHLACLFYSV
jgi:predicted ATPase/DNA-binding CsgD family transcriptional regulator/Tfp pilus assembly protein PilF